MNASEKSITDPDISKYLKEIEKSWQESKNVLVTKQQLKDMSVSEDYETYFLQPILFSP